jgi:hypothetical protein
MQTSYGPIYRPEAYESEINDTSQAINEAQGFARESLQAQMKSATAARANAMKIAQLQAETSRYGIDAQRETAMKELVEKAREFDADHGLEIAKAYTAFSSTPDMMFARNDFMSAMGRVGQGLSPTGVTAQPTQPHAKTWEDFSAIAQYNGSTVPGGGGSTGSSGGGGAAAPQSQTASPTDPRVTAASAIMKAAPPSETQGHDDNDYAALEAIRSMYTLGKPGIQKLGPERQKIALAGMARLGYDPRLVQADYVASLPGQRSVRLA